MRSKLTRRSIARRDFQLPAAVCQGLQPRFEHRASNAVEDHLGPVLLRRTTDRVFERLAFQNKEIIDRVCGRSIRPEFQPIHSNDTCATPFANLGCRTPHAAVCSNNQQPLAPSEPCIFNQAEPRGEVSEAYSRGLLLGHPAGLAPKICDRDGDEAD